MSAAITSERALIDDYLARFAQTGRALGLGPAEVVEVEDRQGRPHVTRVWCAVDCGVAVNPDVIRAQMEGGIGFGLGHALYAEIPLEKGAPTVTNFDGYRSLRITEMPQVEVTIIKSDEAPTGVGEPGVPPIGPAVANAWRALTGQRTRALPMIQAGGVV